MKTRYFLLLVGCVSFLFACNEDPDNDPGRDIGALHLSSQNPQPGETLYLAYKSDSNNEESEMESFYHYVVGDRAYPEDIEMKDSAGIWKGSIVIPDSATAVAFNFSSNGKIDNNNKKGYVLPLYNDEGIIPGGKAGAGYFYLRMGSQYEVENDSALVMIEQDLEEHPELKDAWDEPYTYYLSSSDKEKAKSYIDKRIEYYSAKEELSEKELTTLSALHNNNGNKTMTDSLHKVIVEKFPSGKAAKRKYLIDFYEEKDLATRESIFKEFQSKFSGGDDFEKNYMLDMLSSAYAEQENWEKFEEYSQMISDKSSLASTYNNLAWSMAENDQNLDKAAQISKRSLELLNEGDLSEKPDYMTKKQYKNSQEYSDRMYKDTYAFILFKQGNVKEAIKYQREAVGDGKNSEYNERYVQFLLANEEHDNTTEVAAEYIKNNAATENIKNYYKEAFLKTNGSITDFEEKLTELEKAGEEKAIADIQNEMLDEEAPAFNLQDLEGNEIALASLKGKTVILDFWATWCGPCKASFPGMQMAVDKYRDDENVEFLFVNTMENGDKRNEEVSNFISENIYSFHVVMDQPKEEGSNQFKTASDYMISGIPTKIIIGPDGKLRFKKVGYRGNNEQMVKELSIMIKILNNPELSEEDRLITQAF